MGGVVTAIERAVTGARGEPFQWGFDDCALWVADIMRDATGTDFARPLRGYRTARGARKRLRAFAGGGLAEAVDALARKHGWQQVGPNSEDCNAHYKAGDIAVMGQGPGAFLVIFDGTCWVGREHRGVGMFRRDAIGTAWRIPQCRP